MKKIFKYPMTLIFSAFVCVFFVLYLIVPDKELSTWENRYLQMFPKVSLSAVKDGSFMRQYEDYTNDQLPMRELFIKIKALSEIAMLKIENNGIIRGRDSYLFTKEIKGTDIFYKNISIIDEFTSSVPNSVKVAVAPNACAVIADFVPEGAPMPSQPQNLVRLISDKSLLKDANVVDLYSKIKSHGDEYIYYRTDHHWTSLGAYYAYLAISDCDSPVRISELTKHEHGGFLGTLYAKYKGANVLTDTVTYYDIPIEQYITDGTGRDSLYDVSKLEEFDKYGMFMCGNFGFSTLKSGTCKNGKKLMIFKDSYANCLIPFLTYDYEEMSIVDLRYFKGSVKELVSANEDAEILFLYNFDFLNEDNHFYKLMK